MKPETFNLSMLSHPANLKDVRRVMIDITAKAGFSKKDAGSVILAVDEACSNIIRHSYENDYNQKIDLTVKLETQFLTISILDDGLKVDINSIETRDIKEIRPGGLGIYIINQVMDTVEFSHTLDGKNKIKMIKKLTP